MSTKRPLGIIIVAVLMFIIGLSGVAISTQPHVGPVLAVEAGGYSTLAVAILYIIGGVLLLTMRKYEAKFAMVCLLLIIIVRLLSVATGFYPINTLLILDYIVVGTAVPVIFLIYLKFNLKKFNPAYRTKRTRLLLALVGIVVIILLAWWLYVSYEGSQLAHLLLV